MANTQKLVAAALTGLFTASLLSAGAAFASDAAKGGMDKDKGHMEKANCKTADGKEKHACKGKNSCKGNGADGKNACKGQGSCATDGSAPPAK